MLAVLLLNRMSMKRRNSIRQNLRKPSKSSNGINLIHNNKVTDKIEKKINKKPAAPELCRTCLSAQDLVSLFCNKETEKRRSEELKLVTGLEIRMNDELPQKICIKCVEAINNALTFRRASRKAEKTLLSMTSTPAKKSKKSKIKVTKNKVKKISKSKVELNYNSTNYANDDLNDDGIKCLNNDNINNDDINNDDTNNDDLNNDLINEGLGDSWENNEGVVETSILKSKTKKRHVDIPNASSYKCLTCNKDFRMKSTFKAHMRFHTNFCVCESCGKRCRNKTQLQEHKRARHGLGRIHKCAYCEYSSATKEALVIHERRHTGERPYVCDHCGATFHRRSNLVQHIAIHLPEKNFQCEFCDKREFSHKRLSLHVYTRHKITNFRFLCPVCSGIFTTPRNVRKHLTRIHGVARPDQGRIQKVDKRMVPVTTCPDYILPI